MQENNIDQSSPIMERPRICAFDLPDDVVSLLKDSGYSLFVGSLGFKVTVPNKTGRDGCYVKSTHSFPSNFHEYDVCILDLTNTTTKSYKKEEHEFYPTTKTEVSSLYCSYPATVFDGRPLAGSFIPEMAEGIEKRPFLRVVFACEKYDVDYEVRVLSGHTYHDGQGERQGIYDFWPGISLGPAKSGREVEVCAANPSISSFLNKYRKEYSYEQTFRYPQQWGDVKGSIKDPNFIPLMVNINGDIIAFAYFQGEHLSFVFPNVARKADFLKEFLQHIVVEFIPDIFPFSTEFSWLKNEEYMVPGHESLLVDKDALVTKFENDIATIDQKIQDNARRYAFLQNLLTETGDPLVEAVHEFLTWLDFKKVTIMTERTNGVLEEDIQIEHESGIIILEIKGIGGTSTDDACSQIAKIRTRRTKQRKAFDVSAVYLVNHQRYLPPDKRKNPPFTDHQVNDALGDERGLLTTWQLFQLYQSIENGMISKKDARAAFLNFGLIHFSPKLYHQLGRPKELLKKGMVAIIDLNGPALKKRQTIILEKNGLYSKASIVSIHVNDQETEHAENCEVGLLLDVKIDKSTVLWTGDEV